jgi:hypothetical protein
MTGRYVHGHRKDPKVAGEDGRAGVVSIGVSAAERSQDSELASGAAVAVFQRGYPQAI